MSMENTPEPKKLSAIEFAKEKLNLNPEASYAEIKAQAKFEGIPIFPVVYGRAKALLGLVPTAPYGSKSKARKRAAEEKAERERLAAAESAAKSAAEPAATNGSRRRTERIQSAVSGDPVAGLEAMIDDLRTAVKERDRYRLVLEKITELIQAELSD